MGSGKLIGPVEERVTFEEMTEDLLRDYQVNKRKAVKIIEYPIKHLRKSFALDKALDLTTDRINAHIARRQQEGAKNATINRELAALKRMFSLAVQSGKLSSKPYIPTLEENNARQGFLDYGSFLVLRENLPENRKDPVTFLYHSGWRVSEMKALEWRDVDLPGKVVRLRPEISKNKDGRLLPLQGELLEIIERAKQTRQLSCPYVFHDNGQSIGDFRKVWKRACKQAGLGTIIVHDLRRSAVRNMVRAGIPERVAMSLSGHKTRSVFDRYNIVSEADLARATQRLQAHLEEQPRVPVVVPIIIAPTKTVR
jgi:integrase